MIMIVFHRLWTRPVDGGGRLWTTSAATGQGSAHSRAVTIEVPAAEVYALGAALRSAGGLAGEAGVRLAQPFAVSGPLQAALDGFLECHRTAATALAGELEWLGHTVAAVADSWLRLDAGLLAPRGPR
jgi:hypothetical protein